MHLDLDRDFEGVEPGLLDGGLIDGGAPPDQIRKPPTAGAATANSQSIIAAKGAQ